MSSQFPVRQHNSIHWREGRSEIARQVLVREEPLSIRIQGKAYSVVMRSPGNEIDHVAGFCLAEGIVDRPDEIKTIAFCDGEESNVVTVTLTPKRYQKIVSHLDRRTYISQTSCGLCGKELISDIERAITAIESNSKFSLSDITRCLSSLPELQPLRRQTRATHASAIFDSKVNLLTSAEDVGRHNALDKAIGHLFLKGDLSQATLLILSSRISYELVQKAARANISVIAAYSRPTELAVDLADNLGITLACLAQNDGLIVFSHPDRIYA